MLFSSLVFLSCFLPLVLMVYYVILRKHRKLQNTFLFLASLGFYAWGEPWFVFVMIGSIAGNWVFGLLVDKYRHKSKKVKMIIALSLLFNLSIIYIFKYLMFTVKNINSLFGTDMNVGNIVLPIGISFFTFQAISYVIDIYRGNGEVQRNPVNVGLYIAFFPQLIAGPIVRYETIADQIENRKENFADFSEGVRRFIIGFGKKVLIANNVALVANYAFNLPDEGRSVMMAWVGAVAYTLQIYFDFSGYSDMAIGLGKMFGFHFLENFNYPYVSKSTTEFWRRWHISLGSWFRDYVYIPLGGSRVNNGARLVFNLFVVWFLTGMWHGANWTFIIWGLLYFVTISMEKLLKFENILNGSFLGNAFKHVYTMLLVILGWVMFRAEDVSRGFRYIKSMFEVNSAGFMDEICELYLNEYGFILSLGILLSLPIAKKIGEEYEKRIKKEKVPVIAVYSVSMIIIVLVGIAYLVKGSYNPFIYFNF